MECRHLDVGTARLKPCAGPLGPEPRDELVKLVTAEAHRRIFAGEIVDRLHPLPARAGQMNRSPVPKQLR